MFEVAADPHKILVGVKDTNKKKNKNKQMNEIYSEPLMNVNSST